MTTVPRTLLDLASVLDRRATERAINEAEVHRYTDPLSLPALLARYPRRRGTAAIRSILAADAIGTTLTRSELEERFLPQAAHRDYATTWGHRTASTPDANPPLPGKDETS